MFQYSWELEKGGMQGGHAADTQLLPQANFANFGQQDYFVFVILEL